MATKPSNDPEVTTPTEVATPDFQGKNLDDVMLEGAVELSDEDKEAMTKESQALIEEQLRVNSLTPEEFDSEFGFKVPDLIQMLEKAIDKDSHIHKDRIQSLVIKMKELYF